MSTEMVYGTQQGQGIEELSRALGASHVALATEISGDTIARNVPPEVSGDTQPLAGDSVVERRGSRGTLWRQAVRYGMVVGASLSAAGAVSPAVSQAKIVPGRSIAGVKLGDTEAQVTGLLGTATTTQPPVHGLTAWNYNGNPLMGTVSFRGGKVEGLITYSKQQQTSKRAGVGSSVADIKRDYPGIKCATGPFGPESLICTLKSKVGGHIAKTIFPFFTRTAGAREVDLES